QTGIRDDQIAVLVESDSAYGQGFYYEDSTNLSSNDDKCMQSELQKQPDRHHYHFPFPMHISQLRSVYQRDQRLKAEPLNLYEDQNRAVSELSFDDPTDPQDLPPS